MTLEIWSQNGYIVKHHPTVAEIQKLLGIVDRELKDAAVPGLSADAQFMHAYDAALQLGAIALLASGYKVAKGAGAHGYRINSLSLTLGQQHADTAIYLSTCSTKRHHTLYDYAGVVNEQDAKDLLQTAIQLRADVLSWLRAHHPGLLPKGQ